MGVTRVKQVGSGDLAFSVRLEGDPWEWCDSMDLAGTATSGGFTRIGGLDATGLRISEEPDLIEAKLKAGAFSVVVRGTEADQTFAKRPSIRTYLTTDLPDSLAATNVEVMSTAWITVDSHININTESMKVVGVPDATNLTVERAKFDTVLQKHWADTSIAGLRRPLVTNTPFVRHRRRVRLYWFADADIALGTPATQFWIGILEGDPVREQDGTGWRLNIKPLSELLESDLGSDLGDELPLRGALYNNSNRLWIIVSQLTGANFDDARDAAVTQIRVSVGDQNADPNKPEHFEANDDLCDTINSRLNTASGSWAGWAGRVVAVPRPDGGWGLEVTCDSAKWIRVHASSIVDGFTDSTRLFNPSTDAEIGAGTSTPGVTAGTSYLVPWLDSPPGSRLTPRGTVGIAPGDVGRARTGINTRWLPIGGDVDVTTIGVVHVEWTDGTTSLHNVTATDAAARLIRIDHGADDARVYYQEWLGSPPGIKAIRMYASASDVYGFLSALTTLAPTQGNLGSVPKIYASDLDLAGIQATVDECTRGMAIGTSRVYMHAGPVKLSDYLSEEFKLIGAFLCLASDGKITARPLKQRAPTDIAVTTITGPDPDALAPNGDILDDGDPPQWEPHAYGLVNAVEIKQMYSHLREEHLWRPARFISRRAIGETGKACWLKVAPYSNPQGLTYSHFVEQAAQLAERAFGMFSGEYRIITVEVPLSKFGVLVGDTVTVTSRLIPDPDTGNLGVSGLQCIVIGRQWEPYAAGGLLTLYSTGQRIAGWAPCARIDSAMASGPDWDLTIDTSLFFGPSDLLSDHFKDGERIQVTRFDSVTPGTITGGIKNVNDVTGVITVQLDAAWVPGADVWDLETAPATDSSLAERQKKYGFEANSAGRIPFASGAEAAQTFAAG